jgi:CelD/BcsL family acetyltransferase involved in cellulose biosynthesis
MLRCRLIENPEDLDRYSVAWNDLANKGESTDIFATFGFARAWWGAYGASKRLQLIIVEEEPSSKVRLIAPFYTDSSSPGVLKRMGDTQADYENLVFAAGDVESLACFLSWFRKQRNWRLLLLNRVPEHAAILSYFPCPIGPSVVTHMKILSWLDFRYPLVYRRWQNVHPRVCREDLIRLKDLVTERYCRKRANWFSRKGVLNYRCISNLNECLSILGEFMRIHIAEWGQKGQKSLFLESDNCNFYKFLVKELAPCGAIRIDVLSLDDRIIAAHFGFTWNGIVHHYKPCYDPAFSSHSPGTLLLAHTIRSAVMEEAKELDLLLGREAWKEEIASDIRTTGSLSIHRSRLRVFFWRINFVARKYIQQHTNRKASP